MPQLPISKNKESGTDHERCYNSIKLHFIDAKEPGENNCQPVFLAPLNFLQGC